MTMNNIGRRSRVINNLHGSCVVGSFDKKLHEGSILTGHRAGFIFYPKQKKSPCTSW